jgi:hypothetical protein
MSLNLIKLVVGCDTVEDLIAWRRPQAGQPWILRTRQTPKRALELLEGGSVYRVFKGLVLCRQRILAIDTVGEGQEARCQITLDEEVVLTEPLPRRPFQGWRYFEGKDAPADLAAPGDAAHVPQDLAARLREIGAW